MKRPRKNSLQKMNALSSIDEIMSIIEQDGAVVLTGLANEVMTSSLQEEIATLFAKASFCQGLFFGQKTKRLHALITKAKSCQAIISHPIILHIMDRILGPFCEKYQLNLTQGIQIWPGEFPQLLHRDDSMFPAHSRTCEFMANVMWACSKFTAENGGTVLALGSHKWEDRDRVPTPDDLTQAVMAAGEALIYLGSLVHGGGGNYSDAPRTGIAIGYCLGWLRQYENQYLAAPPAVARNLSATLQDLLGYAVHRPNLGMHEGNEPKILFQSSSDKEIVTQDWLTPAQNQHVKLHHASLLNR